MAWETKKPRIGIAIPFYDKVDMEFVTKTWTPLVNTENWCEKVTILSRAPSLPQVRNTMVEQAILAKCDYLLMVDSDIVFEGNEFTYLKKLYDVQKPIVSGIYRVKKKEGFHPAAWLKTVDDEKKEIRFDPIEEKYMENPENICQVDLIGMGCCLIKMDVFQKLQAPWFKWDTNKDFSEDFYFCLRASVLGEDYYPWVHMGVACSHTGHLVITSKGEFRTFKFNEM